MQAGHLVDRLCRLTGLRLRPRSGRRRLTWSAKGDMQEGTMGIDDKIENASEKVSGKAKEAAGKATDDKSLEAEGRKDQAAADVKQAGEKIKDAFDR